MVHGIVSSHHGLITVFSRPGEGRCFDLYFPLAEPLLAAPTAAAGAPAPPLGAGQHVLYVDDDPVMVLMVEGLLQRWGYRVTSNTDPLNTLACLRSGNETFDVIVTDLTMPELSGLDLAREDRPLAAGVVGHPHLGLRLREPARRGGARRGALPDAVEAHAGPVGRPGAQGLDRSRVGQLCGAEFWAADHQQRVGSANSVL